MLGSLQPPEEVGSKAPCVELVHGPTRVVIDPNGGYIDSFSLNGQDVFFPRGIVDGRGGMHICFPQAGTDTSGILPQHGFARNQEWSTKILEDDGGPARVTLTLKSNDSTQRTYPYQFSAELTYHALDNGLLAHLLVNNEGGEPMPIAPAFHPYFVNDINLPGFISTELFAADKNTHAWVEPSAIYNERGQASFITSAIGRVVMDSAMLRHLVLWSDQSPRYVCVEPFSKPPLSFPEDVIMVEPKQAKSYQVFIGVPGPNLDAIR